MAGYAFIKITTINFMIKTRHPTNFNPPKMAFLVNYITIVVPLLSTAINISNQHFRKKNSTLVGR